MKTYEIELQRTSSAVVTVRANTRAEAKTEVWRRIENNEPNIYDAEWEITSIEELKELTHIDIKS